MGWIYKSAKDLRSAGYVYLYKRLCRGVKCRKEITIWRSPRGPFVAINPDSWERHECEFTKPKGRDHQEIAASQPDDPVARRMARPLPELPQMELFEKVRA